MNRHRTAALFVGLGLLVLAGVALELFYDRWWPIPVRQVIAILLEPLGLEAAAHGPDADQMRFIVLDVRVPRLLLAILVGGGLALCGAVMQAIFHNPLADPSLLGVANGGALGAVIAIQTGLAGAMFLSIPLCALAGGLAAALAVYLVAMTIGRLGPITLILGGVAMGFLFSSATMLVLILGDEWELKTALVWLAGSIKDRSWDYVALAGPVIAAGSVALVLFSRELDILAMGEHAAAGLGVSVGRMRLVLLALASVVTAVAVACSGVIAFVGLVVPHLLRLVVGPLSRRLLPASFLGGAVFILLADSLARNIHTRVQIQLGILSSLVGVPVLLMLLRRQTRQV